MWPLIKVPARLIFTKVITLSFWVTSKCCLEIALRKFSSGTREHQNSGGCMDLPTRILPIGPGHSLWLPLDPKEDKQTWCLLNSTTSLAGGGAGSAWLKDIFSCSAGLRPYSHSIYPALMMSPSSSVASDSTWLPFRRIPFELRFFTMLLDPLKRTSRSGVFQDTQTKCNDDTAWYTSLPVVLLVIHPVKKKNTLNLNLSKTIFGSVNSFNRLLKTVKTYWRGKWSYLEVCTGNGFSSSFIWNQLLPQGRWLTSATNRERLLEMGSFFFCEKVSWTWKNVETYSKYSCSKDW